MPWWTQSRDGDIEVKVNGGTSHDKQVNTTDILIIDHSKSSPKAEHITISEKGEVIHDTTKSVK